MDDLLREAIADAKAVRETALANAKIALEEAFTPRLQSMLSKKIAAEVENAEEDEVEETEDAEENDHEEMREQDAEESEHEESEMEESEHEESEMEEEEAEESDHEEMRGMDEEEAEESEMEEEEAEESEVEESEDAEEEEMREQDAEESEVEEDELDLESVLRELEADLEDEDSVDEEYEESEVEDGHNQDEVEVDDEKLAENDVSSDIGKSDNKVNAKANDSSATGAQGPEGEGSDKKAGTELGDHEIVKEEEAEESEHEEDLDLDEVLKALTEEEAEEQDAEENEKLKSELKETRKVVRFMRDKLNEVNLLNAKLLFSNKLFRAFGLNNNQKLKVVETFDRAANLREVKLVYATLAESFKRPSKTISESVSKGSSSKPVASTKPAKQEVLSEGAEMRARFKKLANIL